MQSPSPADPAHLLRQSDSRRWLSDRRARLEIDEFGLRAVDIDGDVVLGDVKVAQTHTISIE
jgi:hypothetical protein